MLPIAYAPMLKVILHSSLICMLFPCCYWFSCCYFPFLFSLPFLHYCCVHDTLAPDLLSSLLPLSQCDNQSNQINFSVKQLPPVASHHTRSRHQCLRVDKVCVNPSSIPGLDFHNFPLCAALYFLVFLFLEYVKRTSACWLVMLENHMTQSFTSFKSFSKCQFLIGAFVGWSVPPAISLHSLYPVPGPLGASCLFSFHLIFTIKFPCHLPLCCILSPWL